MRDVSFKDLSPASLKSFLDAKVEQYNRPEFIEQDPVSIPHKFSLRQDIEIMGFWAAVLSWGQRKTIIRKCEELIALMDGSPYDFILNHQPSDLKRFATFKHRTFNDTDALYFVEFFKHHYARSNSLESAFIPEGILAGDNEFRNDYLPASGPASRPLSSSPSCYAGLAAITSAPIERALNYFRRYFFSLADYPERTVKHISAPERNSACKRLNMFLRWMVRKDENGVDFGIWDRIRSSELICPLDLHVDRVARKLKLIDRRQTDWKAALELTANLKLLDEDDPVKYDFALFGLGIEDKFQNQII